LLGERQKFVQVFVNLLTNACDACQPGDHVRLRAQAHGGGVEIEVQDQGSGISEEALEQVFEPFFTTKEPGEGTGLGLPLVYSIVQDHG
ncbi:MAG: GHKL domain-containing protein, partial [Anaerolineae bacterium]|nr:GHKL domain-containing protein [Anaerolineae bacterium]